VVAAEAEQQPANSEDTSDAIAELATAAVGPAGPLLVDTLSKALAEAFKPVTDSFQAAKQRPPPKTNRSFYVLIALLAIIAGGQLWEANESRVQEAEESVTAANNARIAALEEQVTRIEQNCQQRIEEVRNDCAEHTEELRDLYQDWLPFRQLMP